MRLQAEPPVHLTYCLNIHPGETWEENLRAIRDKSLVVRDRVAPQQEFGLGLRLSYRAARALHQPDALRAFREFLRENRLYVFTVNGFPFGDFHGKPVKDDVYRPDWRSAERRDYTLILAEILSQLLPEDAEGSISTVPGSYKGWVRGKDDVETMVRMLADCACGLAEIRRRTGRLVHLGLEPEPDCFVENTDEVIDFLTGPLIGHGSEYLRKDADLSAPEADRVLREHVGVCVDTCHLAVEFEDPTRAIGRLTEAGIRVSKVQLSSALRTRPTPEARAELAAFSDPVYLHQVKARRPDGTTRDYADLTEALASPEEPAGARDEWRVHFHVPLFFERTGSLRSTASLLTPEFFRTMRAGVTQHLEIETYTFDVLPPSLRREDVTAAIAREYDWVLDRLGTAAGGKGSLGE